MTSPYTLLADRIRGQLADLEREVQYSLQMWPKAQGGDEDTRAFLDSTALHVESFYSGLERLFVLIARHLDRSVPASDSWHVELLHQMAADRDSIRPALISPATEGALEEVRKFRHRVRHIYAAHLEAERMEAMMAVLPGTWTQLEAELRAFADLMEDLAKVE